MTKKENATYQQIQKYLKLQQIMKDQILDINKSTNDQKLKNITRICNDAFNPENANKKIDSTMTAFMQEFKTSSIRKELGRLRQKGYNQVRAKATKSVGWIKRAKAALKKITGKKKAEPPELSSRGKRNLFK
jgi:hypothetical protein